MGAFSNFMKDVCLQKASWLPAQGMRLEPPATGLFPKGFEISESVTSIPVGKGDLAALFSQKLSSK